MSFAAVCPAVAAGAPWVVTHNLGSQDVIIMIRRSTTPFDFVDAYIEATSVNTVTLKPDVALAAGAFTAIIKK